MTIRPRTMPALAALLLGLCLALGCGKADEHEGGKADHGADAHAAAKPAKKTLKAVATATPGPVNERGEKLYTYDAELLLAHRRTAKWIVDMPAVIASLAESRGNVIAGVQVSIECANEATYEEMESKKKNFTAPITDAISGKTLGRLRTMRGKLELKEEIVRRYRESPYLEHKEIRDVYFRAFGIQVGR